jgi:hypothetical protein
VWGAILNLATAACLLALLKGDAVIAFEEPKVMVGIVCAAQVALAAPVLIALAMKKSLPSLPPRVRAVCAALVIAGLVGVCALKVAGVVKMGG